MGRKAHKGTLPLPQSENTAKAAMCRISCLDLQTWP